eukprot:84725-Amorphochlora_amoeboformis.AAC.1
MNSGSGVGCCPVGFIGLLDYWAMTNDQRNPQAVHSGNFYEHFDFSNTLESSGRFWNRDMA